MNKDGSCYLGMVEDAINNCKKVIDSKKTHIVLRSTVPPGTASNLDVYFMPEFLTEKIGHKILKIAKIGFLV